MHRGVDLNYIWEALLEVQKADSPLNDIQFIPSFTHSPYMETSFEDLNPYSLTQEPVQVNARYRFAPIFDSLLDGQFDNKIEVRNTLYNLIMHLLGWMDLRSGLHKKEYYALFLSRDIVDGKFNKKYSEAIKMFPIEKKRFIFEHLVLLYTIGPSIEMLRSLICQLYTNSLLYLDKCDNKDVLIYIGRKQTPELAQQLSVICDFFVPFDYIVHLFWELHFGIIDVDETMDLDEFMIY